MSLDIVTNVMLAVDLLPGRRSTRRLLALGLTVDGRRRAAQPLSPAPCVIDVDGDAALQRVLAAATAEYLAR